MVLIRIMMCTVSRIMAGRFVMVILCGMIIMVIRFLYGMIISLLHCMFIMLIFLYVMIVEVTQRIEFIMLPTANGSTWKG